MYPECTGTTRRHFLRDTVGATTLLAAAGATAPVTRLAAAEESVTKRDLPCIQLGEHKVTRLIAGYNPIGGHSHTTLNMARVMREYFTPEQTAEFLLHCERVGINTWQYDHTDKVLEALTLARDRGSKLQVLCLHAERPYDAPLTEVMRQKPIAIVHHGGVTDGMFRAGKADRVRDFVKKVHDAGALAGISTHCPENLKRMAEEGWENDFFMACFYYVSRPRDDMRKELPKVPVGEPFFESDPEDMTAAIQQVGKPCLGFKILAAGRVCWNQMSVDRAFEYAFKRLKPTDAVIVGMFPKYADEVAMNADYVMEHGKL